MTQATRGLLFWRVLELKHQGFSPAETVKQLLGLRPKCQNNPMPIEDVDIWRAVRLLLDRHKEVAGLVAAQKADELLEAGDIEGSNIWKRIVAAIDEWQRGRPRSDERIN